MNYNYSLTTLPADVHTDSTRMKIYDSIGTYNYILSVNELVADRTITLPILTANDEFVFNDHTQTLTNKTLTAPLITGVTKLDGGITMPIVSKSGNYTITDSDYTIICTASSITITLPASSGITGRIYKIKHATAASTVTLNCNGIETIDGSSSQSISAWGILTVQSDGTNWFII